MAILFVTHKFPPSIGGMEKQIYELINGVRKFTRVYTIAIRPGENKFWFFYRLKSRIKSMIKLNSDIEIVHCNDGAIASFCSWLKNYKDIKLTATLHGLDIVFPNAVFQNYIIPKLRRFDKLFCVSRATADACIKRGFDSTTVQVIHNGVDIQLKNSVAGESSMIRLQHKYQIDFEKEDIILAVGRAVKRKGFSWFIKYVIPDIKNATFLIVGPIQKPSSICQIILSLLPIFFRTQVELLFGYPSDSKAIYDAMKKANNVIHLSDIPFDDLMQIYTLSRLFVMPNIKVEGDMEGFGLVALEAVLRGCPVVAADIEGIQDAVSHENNGILLPSSDHFAWSAEINFLLNNKSRLHELAKEALQYTTDNFSWDKMCNEYWQSFQELSNKSETISINDIVLT